MKRIQRDTTKGWRMPKNVVYVGRASKWRNPLKLDKGIIYIEANPCRELINPWVYYEGGDIGDVLHLYRLIINGTRFINPDLQYHSDRFRELDLSELEDKDLACWCSLNQSCHADVLLELFNE